MRGAWCVVRVRHAGGVVRSVIGVLMMCDGAMQALGVAGLMSTIADRSWRDRGLFLAHLIVGAALIFAGRNLTNTTNLTNFTNPTNPTNFTNFTNRSPCLALLSALALSLVEATWFNWTDAAIRTVYTAVVCVLLFRSTTLPTT